MRRSRIKEIKISLFDKYLLAAVLWICGATGIKLIQAIVGHTDIFVDAMRWRRVANAVTNGTPLYVGAAVDNKPPVWQFISIAAAKTGYFVPVLYLFVLLSNVLFLFLLYRWVTREYDRQVAGITTIGTAVALPLVAGTIINVRSPATALLFLALLAGPFVAGISIGLAGLICQQVGIVAPLLLYFALRRTEKKRRYAVQFIVGIGIVAGLAYGITYSIWGIESLRGSIEHSILQTDDYIVRGGAGSIYHRPLGWGSVMLERTATLGFFVLPAAVYLYNYIGSVSDIFESLPVLFAGFFLLTLGVQPLPYYWVPAVPFLMILASRQLQSMFSTEPNCLE